MVRWLSGPYNAKAVMVGLGSSMRQAWPPVKKVSIAFTGTNDFEMAKFSVAGFDFRTSPLSNRKTSALFNGRITPQGNLAPTYQYRLNNNVFDGAAMSIETVVAPSLKTLALPSSLILACNRDTNYLVAAEFGSNGIRLISLSDTQLLFEYKINIGIPAGSILRVERFLSWIQVFINGIRVGACQHSTFNMGGSPGVGFYSEPAPNMSTPIGATTIIGETSIARVNVGREYFEGGMLPLDTYTEVARMVIPEAGNYLIQGYNIRWTTTTIVSARNWIMKLNGTQFTNFGEQNGSNIFGRQQVVPANSTITLEAQSNGNDVDRFPKVGGYMWYTPSA